MTNYMNKAFERHNINLPDDINEVILTKVKNQIKYEKELIEYEKQLEEIERIKRLNEVTNCWKEANLNNVNIIHSDCDFFEDKDRDAGWVNYIENTFIKNGNYDCIFIPTKDDSQFEHRFVNSLGPALIRVLPISLIEYRTPSTLNTWNHNIFINIENYYKKKMILKTFLKKHLLNYLFVSLFQ